MRPGTWGLVLALSAAIGGRLGAAAPAPAQAAEKRVGSRWALLAGVDNYAEAQKLQFCGADMRSLRKQLVASGFPEPQVFLLDDQAQETKYRPLKANIERQLELVLGLVEQDDLILVAFSGHGVHRDGKSYLCPSETRLADPATMISLDAVYERLQKCRAALKLLLVDACRNDPRVAGERNLGAAEDVQQFARSLERPPEGILLLTSCAPGQVSMEEKEFGHGVFMHYVLEGLQGRADDDRNGRVSLMELYKFANRQTKLYVARKFNGYQTPALKGDIHDDFDVTTASLSAMALAKVGLAKKALSARQYTKALAALDEAIRLDPKTAEAFNQRGNAHFAMGDRQKAIADYSEAIRLAPQSADPYSNRGYAYKQQGDLAKAIADYGEAIRREPANAEYFNLRGIAHYDADQLDKALADYTEAVRLDPKFKSPYYNRGMVHRDRGDDQAAIADFTAALRIDPDYRNALQKRGRCSISTKQYDKAIADYDRAIRLDPHFALAFQERGLAYDNRGDPQKAIADYTEAIRLNPQDAVSHNNRGLIYHNRGEYDKALADYDEAIRLAPKSALYHRHRGDTYRKTEDYDRAIADYNQAIRLDPKYVAAYNARGLAYDDRGDPDTAIADYTEAVRLDPTYWLPYYNRACAHRTKRDYDQAIADFSEAVRRGPKDATTYNRRALCYHDRYDETKNASDLDRAIADYTEAVRLDPQFATALENRAIAYRDKRLPALAEADAKKARQVRLARQYPAGAIVRVRVASAKVQDQSETVAEVAKGQKFRVLGARDEWVLVEVRGRRGWLSKLDVE